MERDISADLARLHDVITRIHAVDDLDTVLQLIADGVTDVSGFEVSTINVYLPETDELELVAQGGHDPLVTARLHHRYDASALRERSRRGEAWGLFRFVSHTLGLDTPRGFIVLDLEETEAPGAWHPLDELSVELAAPDGRLLGVMFVDRPADGMLPPPSVRAAMEVYAVVAGVAINHAQQRAAEHEQAWLGGMVRAVIDHLAAPDDLGHRLERALEQLRGDLQAPLGWLDVFSGVEVSGIAPVSEQPVFTVVAALDSYGPDLALSGTESGQAVLLDRARLGREHPLLNDQQRAWLVRALETDDVHSIVVAPLDNDEELAGQLLLGRRTDRAWTTAELESVREVGRELGWALGRQRSRERELSAEEDRDRAVRERLELLDALTLEIGPVLSRVDVHTSTLAEDDPAREAMEWLWALLNRLRALVALETPAPAKPSAIDLAAVLGLAWPHLAGLGRAGDVQVLPLETTAEQLAWADPDELDWVVVLLTEDVVRRAAPGSAVRFGLVTLNHRLVLSCQVSGQDGDDDAPASSGSSGPGASAPWMAAPSWWLPSAQHLISRSDGRLVTREGPMGRRTVSLSLPVPPQL